VDLDALVTAAEAASLMRQAGVTRHMIYMWVRAGKVQPRGMRGRFPLYRWGDLLQAERATRRSGYSHRAAA
jgi:hypothetical protein